MMHIMDMAAQHQVLDETACISHDANIFGEGMYPTILSLLMSK